MAILNGMQNEKWVCQDFYLPDYQMSAFLMAVYFQGMSSRETTDFLQSIAISIVVFSLSYFRLF